MFVKNRKGIVIFSTFKSPFLALFIYSGDVHQVKAVIYGV